MDKQVRFLHRYLVDCFLLQSALLLLVGVLALQYLPVGGAIAGGVFAVVGFVICLSQFVLAHGKFLQLFFAERGKDAESPRVLPPCIGG